MAEFKLPLPFVKEIDIMAYCNCPNCFETYDGESKPLVCKKCGFPFKGNNENDKEYIRLFATYSNKPTEELEKIIEYAKFLLYMRDN